MSDLQRRTEQLLRDDNYLTASVERRKRFPDPKSRRCKACGSVRMLDIASDMFGVFDLIALRHCGTRQNHPLDFVFVQVTSSTNHATRRKKILASPEAKLCVLSGARILIQSWKKRDNRWQPSDEWLTLDQFDADLPSTAEEFYERQKKAKQPDYPPGSQLFHSPIKDSEIPF